MILFPFILLGALFLAFVATFALIVLGRFISMVLGGAKQRSKASRARRERMDSRSSEPFENRVNREQDRPPLRRVAIGRMLLFFLFPPYTLVAIIVAVVALVRGLLRGLVAILEILIDALGILIVAPGALVGGERHRRRMERLQCEVGRDSRTLVRALLLPVRSLARDLGFEYWHWRLGLVGAEPTTTDDDPIGVAESIVPPPLPVPMAPFAGRYQAIEQIPGGGSSAELYIVQRVVDGEAQGERLLLKCFDLTRGAGLDNLVRESEGMRLAKRVGIVSDYMFGDDYFYYVMPYFSGETLGRKIGLLFRHKHSSIGLSADELRMALGYAREVVVDLARYHQVGLIHKDIKPENVILTTGGARLVDIGLVTQLSSAMTLTTHGTEYFRDPELVRQAVAGTKVNEIAAERFDLYSVGALIYFVCQGTFPATGRFSRYSRPAPYAVMAVANKAMSDFDQRYRSADELLADLDAILKARTFDEVKPASLPSFRREQGEDVPLMPRDEVAATRVVGPAAMTAKLTPKPVHNFATLALVLVAIGVFAGAGILGFSSGEGRLIADAKREVMPGDSIVAEVRQALIDSSNHEFALRGGVEANAILRAPVLVVGGEIEAQVRKMRTASGIEFAFDATTRLPEECQVSEVALRAVARAAAATGEWQALDGLLIGVTAPGNSYLSIVEVDDVEGGKTWLGHHQGRTTRVRR